MKVDAEEKPLVNKYTNKEKTSKSRMYDDVSRKLRSLCSKAKWPRKKGAIKLLQPHLSREKFSPVIFSDKVDIFWNGSSLLSLCLPNRQGMWGPQENH